MTRSLISFDDGAMAHIPDTDSPAEGEALAWAAKIAVASLCAQEVRELMGDLEV